MKRFIAIWAVVCACGGILADGGAGWQPTANGKYSFDDSTNWDEGDINGVFGEEWKSATADVDVYLTKDWNGTLKVLGNVAARTLLRSSNGPWTIYLNDDLYLTPSAMNQDFVFGNSYTAKEGLNFDLGGVTRTIHLSGTRWILSNRMVNGNVVFDGTAGKFTLRSAAGFDGDVRVSAGLQLDSSQTSRDNTALTGENAVVRAHNLTLARAIFNSSAGNQSLDEKLDGDLIIDGGAGGVSVLSLNASANKTSHSFTADNLRLENGGVLVVNGLNLGQPPGSGIASCFFGGLADGEIVPGVLAGKTAVVTADGYGNALVRYSAEKGLVPLESVDYCDTIEDSGNFKVSQGESVSVESNARVRTLTLAADNYNGSIAAEITGQGRLAVESGMVCSQAIKNGATLGVELDFGEKQGYIINGSSGDGKTTTTLSKHVYGSGGLVLAHTLNTTVNLHVKKTSGIGSISITADGDEPTAYTGDTYVQCLVQMNGKPFLPHGGRKGDVYVNGTLELSSSAAADIGINGLYGNGLVYGRGGTLTVGGNDADGDFGGQVSYPSDNTAKLANLDKTGSGTQRLSGNSIFLSSALNVKEGKVVLNGTVTSGNVKVFSGAAISGQGEIQTSLAFEDGGIFAVDVVDGAAEALTVAGAVTGSNIKVQVTESGAQWKEPVLILKSDTPIAATFAKGSDNIASIYFNDDKTEVWAAPKKSGLFLIIR
ncbi:MAG: hypothetical protein IJ802_04700 [Kiritimatiellae bacterium]|nr:hypothetical protein [Kiritimatiellia bacterium]